MVHVRIAVNAWRHKAGSNPAQRESMRRAQVAAERVNKHSIGLLHKLMKALGLVTGDTISIGELQLRIRRSTQLQVTRAVTSVSTPG